MDSWQRCKHSTSFLKIPYAWTFGGDVSMLCFFFLYKASFVFLLVGMGVILVSFTLLSTGSNPSEASISNEALCHVYIFCSLQHSLS